MSTTWQVSSWSPGACSMEGPSSLCHWGLQQAPQQPGIPHSFHSEGTWSGIGADPRACSTENTGSFCRWGKQQMLLPWMHWRGRCRAPSPEGATTAPSWHQACHRGNPWAPAAPPCTHTSGPSSTAALAHMCSDPCSAAAWFTPASQTPEPLWPQAS